MEMDEAPMDEAPRAYNETLDREYVATTFSNTATVDTQLTGTVTASEDTFIGYNVTSEATAAPVGGVLPPDDCCSESAG